MDLSLLNLHAQEAPLLTRAQEIYRWKNLRHGEPGDVVAESLGTYVTLYQKRYGSEEDALSEAVVHGPRRRRPSHADLDEVAREVVAGPGRERSSPADLDEVARLLVNGGASDNGNARNGFEGVKTSRILPNKGPADLTPKEPDLLAKAMVIYERKNGRGCQPKDVVIESLELYTKLYELLSAPRDELSRGAVFGPRNGDTPAADLDEVARRLVIVGRCYRRGDCCRRTIGVQVSERDILRIEETGRERKEFLDEDGRLKAGSGGCNFFVAGPDGSPNCQIYANRPEACRNFFCNRGPLLKSPVSFSTNGVRNRTRSNGTKPRNSDA